MNREPVCVLGVGQRDVRRRNARRARAADERSEAALIVELKIDPDGNCVHVGNRYEDHLTKDEALYIIACLIVTGDDGQAPYLRTKEQHAAADAEHAKAMAKLDEEKSIL